jgi:hypothetical protein
MAMSDTTDFQWGERRGLSTRRWSSGRLNRTAAGALSIAVTVSVLAGTVVADALASIGIFGAQSTLYGFAFVVLLGGWRPRAPA